MTQRQLFLRHLAPTSDIPLMLEIALAEGVYLYDTEGRKILDLISGIGVSSLGHRHPAVENAVRDQVGKYWHTMVYGEFVLTPQVQLARLLCEHLPAQLDSVYFVNSGTEATEGAMKLAKRATGRPEIIACRQAYHGSTQGAASLMCPTDFTQPYHPLLPGIRHINFNDENDLEKINGQTAAVILEVIQAEAGVKTPQNQYFKKLRRRCDKVGALLILDEVQTGFGRTGSLFAFQNQDIVPDVLLLAKGMGGGMPIGAFVASQALMQHFAHHPPLGHITTFGGHPVSCAAAFATLQTLLAGDYISKVKTKEVLFKEQLAHPLVKEIRSAGLLMAVEIGAFDLVLKAVRLCLDRGLLIDWFLFDNCSLRIAPPLIISESEIESACAILRSVFDELYHSKSS